MKFPNLRDGFWLLGIRMRQMIRQMTIDFLLWALQRIVKGENPCLAIRLRKIAIAYDPDPDLQELLKLAR